MTIFARFMAIGLYALALTSFGQSAPTRGLVHNTEEASSLSYDCTQSGSKLICEFVQSSVRKKASAKDLPEALNRARKEASGGKKFASDEECKSYSRMIEILAGREKAPKPEFLEKMTELERRDLASMGNALSNLCKSPSIKAYEDMAKLEHSKKTRSCTVSSMTFKQTFSLVSGPGEPPVWVTDSRPEGACGIVQLSRFTAEAATSNASLLFWKYTARKAITNPDAIAFPGFNDKVKCGDLDQKEYLYDWRSKEHTLQCDYVEFTVL
jgi:hypothetical protein